MTHVFKNGDKVMVIDHRPADAHEHPVWTDSMDEFMGRTGIVEQVCFSDVVKVEFSDNTAWNYKPEWIMPIKERDFYQPVIAHMRSFPFAQSPAINTPLIQHKKLLTTIKLY